MMTLLQARTRIRYRIGEEEESFWKNVELNSYINDAKDDLYNAILTINKDFFQKSATIQTSTVTNRILLPADFQRLKVLRMLTPGFKATMFVPVDRNNPLFIASLANVAYSNQPYQYMYDVYDCIDVPAQGEPDWRGWNLALSPAPNAVLSIGLEYFAQLPDLAQDTDTFSFMNPFTGYILDKATYYALSKGPSGDYGNYQTSAETKLNRILGVASKPTTQGAEFVQGFLEDSY